MPIRSNLLVDEISEHSPIHELEANEVLLRLWNRDHTLWSDSSDEIDNRLGWLDSPREMTKALPAILEFAEDVRQDFSHVLLLGMGGSSLAPELFARVFGAFDGYPDLHVLDSTDPAAVLHYTKSLNPKDTLYIVSTKSGGTVETLSFFKHFYNQVNAAVGAAGAGSHFVAITDPGSSLESLAGQYKFRKVFLNDPNIGGRFSALSYFGLVPAALLGIDVGAILEQARFAAHNDSPYSPRSLGLNMGALIAYALGMNRDKLTFIASPDLEPFVDWAEQLIAESTGKAGVGILPLLAETISDDTLYGPDRQFVALAFGDETGVVGRVANLRAPSLSLILDDEYDLGGLFFHWEVAVAIACHMMGVNPFDQPDVESAKRRAQEMVKAYQASGELPPIDSAPLDIKSLESFLGTSEPGSYVALQAFIQPTPAATRALESLQTAIVHRTGMACTIGFGPRFLHSTGQLHKGDGGKGLFIQFVSTPETDVPIPDEAGKPDSSISFGVLKQAQAHGDARALRDAGRKVITFTLAGNDLDPILELADLLDP
ncbi:MAG: glucose-6-phosphate isomerase [Anaerolineae bacterium]|nr:MAG: glucose-6-phosphate isomerase [Anaerolineae bacterium]